MEDKKIEEMTGTAGVGGSYETPIDLGDDKEEINEEDYIELDEQLFEKMVINKLMTEEVYNTYAMNLTNKKQKKTTETLKITNPKPVAAKDAFSNKHNEGDIAVERGNNGLDSMNPEAGEMAESLETQLEDEPEMKANVAKRNKFRAKVEPQLGDDFELNENKTFKFNKIITEANLTLFLKKKENELKGRKFYVKDSFNKIHVNWKDYEKAFVTGDFVSETVQNNINKLMTQ
jgi:hypothetical protein